MVDLEKVLSRLNNQQTPYAKWLKTILSLEDYTLLQAPYEPEAVDEILSNVRKELKIISLPKEYQMMAMSFDGGYLFSDTIYSIYNPDDPDDDLCEKNKYLWIEEMLPSEWVAFGETNYGAYICFSRKGDNRVIFWDPVEDGGSEINSFDSFHSWMDFCIWQAKELKKDGSLTNYRQMEEDDG